jgi:hypothetical protein
MSLVCLFVSLVRELSTNIARGLKSVPNQSILVTTFIKNSGPRVMFAFNLTIQGADKTFVNRK